MSQELTSAELGAASIGMSLDHPDKKRAYEKFLENKWSAWTGEASVKRGYPEIKSEQGRLSLATIMENQHRFQNGHFATTPYGQVPIQQDVTTADEALPTRFAMPIVRRVYALMINADWMVTQPLPGPTGYIFYLDFVRENDSTNTLSVEYNNFLAPVGPVGTGELSVPLKGKLQLQRQVVTAVKQIMGIAFSVEAQEDAQAMLGLDIERELLSHFSTEFVRNLFGRQIKAISVASKAFTNLGTGLGTPWSANNTQHTFPDKGATTIADYKALIYNKIIDADADFQRANRQPSSGIICGYGLAAYLQKLNTATQSQAPVDNNMTSLGITDYGTYAGRWQIWATDFMPDDEGIMYRRNPSWLEAGFVYAPYVPIQVMPAMYADYKTTGEYTNVDAYTRNIRERSAYTVTKGYAFQPLKGPPAGVGQW